MFPQNNLVFIGNSLVSISQSVKKLNKRVINIDSFNDTDLVGENFINSDQRGYVNQDVLLVLEKLNLRKNDTLIVVSGEYDSDKDYYNELSEFGYIAGNKQSTIQEIYNHEKLFEILSIFSSEHCYMDFFFCFELSAGSTQHWFSLFCCSSRDQKSVACKGQP